MTVKEYALAIDLAACCGCMSCSVACKQEHDLPVGPQWITVHRDDIRMIDGRPRQRYTVTHCMHCHEPRCMKACPENAIVRRADGIVLIDANTCTGCRMCMEACSFGVIRFDEERGTAQKCDLCVTRLDKGKQPACVAACISHCIYAGEVADVAKKVGIDRLRLWRNETF